MPLLVPLHSAINANQNFHGTTAADVAGLVIAGSSRPNVIVNCKTQSMFCPES